MRRLALALLVALAACTGHSRGEDLHDRPPSTVSFGGADAVLYVKVADTPDARAQGLMGVADLPTDQGMAFLFDTPIRSTFWMKDTVIALSVAFVDEHDRVIAIRDMQPCESDPCPTYGADAPYVWAIEANLGWFAKHGIEVGGMADLQMSAYG